MSFFWKLANYLSENERERGFFEKRKRERGLFQMSVSEF
jgi:hypothetical protein